MNFFLEVLKLPTLESVEEFNPIDFINEMIRMNQQKVMNAQEEIINAYLIYCIRKHAPEGTPIKNYSRQPVIR